MESGADAACACSMWLAGRLALQFHGFARKLVGGGIFLIAGKLKSVPTPYPPSRRSRNLGPLSAAENFVRGKNTPFAIKQRSSPTFPILNLIEAVAIDVVVDRLFLALG
jgi:hypothetical protein